MEQKKGVTIYLTEREIAGYKEACAVQDRNMANMGAVLLKKFIYNSKRKAEKNDKHSD